MIAAVVSVREHDFTVFGGLALNAVSITSIAGFTTGFIPSAPLPLGGGRKPPLLGGGGAGWIGGFQEISMPRSEALGPCALCGRSMRTTFHHLIPRKMHGNKWFRKRFTRERMTQGADLCRPCHSAVHAFIDEKTLGREYNSVGALLGHPEVARFVAWVRTQPPGRVRTRRGRR